MAEETKIRVVLRIRPFLKNEERYPIISIIGNEAHLKDPNRDGQNTTTIYQYRFDACYDENVKMDDLFKSEVSPAIERSFGGLNTSIACFGMTNSGKTFTMQGTSTNPGFIPMTVTALLYRVNDHSQFDCKLSFSFLEIYNDKIQDLLQSKKDLRVFQDKYDNVVVPDLCEIQIDCLKTFLNRYNHGLKDRQVGCTNINEHSSRSHAVLMLKIRKRMKIAPFRTTTGKIHLVDLAGSENNRITGNTGKRMTESQNINQSLFVLGKVITALNEKQIRIPYRDCKLTRLLQDSLGGKSYAVIVINIAPGAPYFQASYQALNFGTNSKKVVNRPICNVTEEFIIPMSDDIKTTTDNLKHQILPMSSNSSTSKSSRRKQLEEFQRKRAHASSEQNPPPGKRQRKNLEQNKTQENNPTNQLQSLSKNSKSSEYSERTKKRYEHEKSPHPKNNSKLLQMTPTSAAMKAKDYVSKAKTFEKSGELTNASRSYNEALKFLPDNKKLKSIIRQLQTEIIGLSSGKKSKSKHRRTTSNEKENNSKSIKSHNKKVHSSRSLTENNCDTETKKINESITQEEIMCLFDILNNGDKKRLMKLQMIGVKKAELIIKFAAHSKFTKIEDLKNINLSETGMTKFINLNKDL